MAIAPPSDEPPPDVTCPPADEAVFPPAPLAAAPLAPVDPLVDVVEFEASPLAVSSDPEVSDFEQPQTDATTAMCSEASQRPRLVKQGRGFMVINAETPTGISAVMFEASQGLARRPGDF